MAPLHGCKGVSVRKRKSGVWWSSRVMMSAREGLLAPLFLALRVRNVSSCSAGWAVRGVARNVSSLLVRTHCLSVCEVVD
jgi:hypothetical protein